MLHLFKHNGIIMHFRDALKPFSVVYGVQIIYYLFTGSHIIIALHNGLLENSLQSTLMMLHFLKCTINTILNLNIYYTIYMFYSGAL